MQGPFHQGRLRPRHACWRPALPPLIALLTLPLLAGAAFAHAVAAGDKGYIQEISGINVLPFIYLGAKHMVTGYDHILFLFGVIFFLYRMKHIGIYVSLFALGHSTTMLLGVYFNVGINSYIIDAIIGLSVVYKALDNLGAFQRWLGFQPNTKVATLVFGFFHGFGLSTKIIEYNISSNGLVPNLLAFNVGVEIGQLLALGAILIVMGYWRRTRSFWRHAYTANVIMMTAGFLLIGYQLTGLFVAA
ncbi:HupE/UreJ family protein [Mesorhizobium sp. M0046]|uniref:HupE/UreJ family protein n=1 Tax=Mesorhizobium sp. M0046 TaxID=2956858 RepID=UPI003334D1E7